MLKFFIIATVIINAIGVTYGIFTDDYTKATFHLLVIVGIGLLS